MLKAVHVAAMLVLAAFPRSAQAEDPPTTVWVRSWNAPANHEDIGRFVAVDTPDRIYVAGSTYEPGAQGAMQDYLLLQYDASGNLTWFRRYGGSGGETLSDLVVPTSGEVIVTGFSPGLNGTEVATVKYDHLGNLLWDRRHPAEGALLDFGPKLAVDRDGNVIVSASDAADYLLLKYSANGTLLWSRTYDGPTSGDDVATDVAVDSLGDIYVTGTVNSSHAFGTVKFSSSGDFRWAQIEPGDIGSVFAPSKVRVGPDNNAVVAGNPESTCGVFQFKIWKCASADGAVLWSDKAPDQPCNSLIFGDLVLDGDGAALAVCSGTVDGDGTHMQVLRYSAGGVREWIREFDGPGSAEDVAAAIATDPLGAAYAMGYTTFPPQNRDYAAVKFSGDGQQQWSFTWASAQGTNDLGEDICLDPAGNVILTGHSFNPAENEDVVTIKLRQVSSAGINATFGIPEQPPSLQAWPNPVSGSARIRFVLPHEGWTRLDLLDAEGRLFRRLIAGPSSTGRHEIVWSRSDGSGSRVPAGVYFLRLEAAGTIRTSRTIVLP
jgi:hypothetical protein